MTGSILVPCCIDLNYSLEHFASCFPLISYCACVSACMCVCGDGVKRVGGREGVEQVSAEISVWYTQTSRLVDRAAGRKRRE